jgi:hypothetical protein
MVLDPSSCALVACDVRVVDCGFSNNFDCGVTMQNLHEFLYECDELGLALKCFFEYEPAEVGSVEPMSGLKLEPDYPEVWTLVSVFLPNSNVDLSGVLHPDVISQIERDAATYFEEMKEEKYYD